jgi:muconolactone D-isomerase
VLFHVVMNVSVPFDFDSEKLSELNEQEHERARDVQNQGKWPHLWRVAGKFANISVFDVDGPAELHEILSSLPLYPFMDIEVTALCHHPGSIASGD